MYNNIKKKSTKNFLNLQSIDIVLYFYYLLLCTRLALSYKFLSLFLLFLNTFYCLIICNKLKRVGELDFNRSEKKNRKNQFAQYVIQL